MQHHTLIAHQFDQAIRQATLSVRFGFGAIVCFVFWNFGKPTCIQRQHMDLLCLSLFAVRTHRHDDAHQPVSRLFIDALSGDGRLNFGGHFGNWDSAAWIYGRVGIEHWHRYGVFMALFLAMIAWFGMPFFISGQSKKFASFWKKNLQNHPKSQFKSS